MDQTPAHEIANATLLAQIPRDASKIIEFGCSSGALAREYKAINPDCHYVGVEIDNRYAQMASRYCDQVLVADLDAVGDDFFSQHTGYDCWIFGDVLEHLRDPWLMLERVRRVISEDGCVVACIPNAQHWSVISRLLLGDFHYEESGLLDRTHLRWFTRKTMSEMFQRTGYRVDTCVGRIVPSNNQGVIDKLTELASALNASADEIRRDLSVIQFVFRVSPNCT